MTDCYEIIWHGRGGQGAVTAATIFAQAAFYEGFKGVSAKPTYFSERRGAPVSVHTRISRFPIRTFSNIIYPDVAVVLDDNLLEMVNVTADLKECGVLILNSKKTPQELGISGPFTIGVADAFHCSEAAGLIVKGNVLVSTSILGPLAATSNLVGLESMRRSIARRFKGKDLDRNVNALELAYKVTSVFPNAGAMASANP